MNGLILLEGNKGTYKSTITAQLGSTFNCDIQKGIPKGEKSLIKNYSKASEAQAFLLSFWKNIISQAQSDLIILDRTYISSVVYHNVFSDSSRQFIYISDEQIHEIENQIKTVPYALIYLYDTVDNLWDRYTVRGTHDIPATDFIRNKAELSVLNQKYEEFFQNTTCLEYLRTDCRYPYPHIINSIENYVKRLKQENRKS